MTPILGNLRDTPNRDAALASYARLAPDYDASCGWLGQIVSTHALGASSLASGTLLPQGS